MERCAEEAVEQREKRLMKSRERDKVEENGCFRSRREHMNQRVTTPCTAALFYHPTPLLSCHTGTRLLLHSKNIYVQVFTIIDIYATYYMHVRQVNAQSLDKEHQVPHTEPRTTMERRL